MDALMLGIGNYGQTGWIVITAVAVDVMHVFIWKKISAKSLLHDYPMQSHPPDAGGIWMLGAMDVQIATWTGNQWLLAAIGKPYLSFCFFRNFMAL